MTNYHFTLLFIFLSTLSLRRATLTRVVSSAGTMDFYPRSPCGERPHPVTIFICVIKISIHALLAESDALRQLQFTLCRNFYPRSPCGERHFRCTVKCAICNFYPRSPCGERQYLVRGQRPSWEISIHALLAESDYGDNKKIKVVRIFLSTLSLRRATTAC